MPWAVIGLPLIAIAIYEAYRHHRITSDEIIFFLVLVPTVVLHEISHGVVAYWCGDDTAKRAGRLSLNPFRHIDPIGTIILPIFLILTTGRAFGWAKPVPVNVSRLRHPRNQAVLTALAGPVTNILIAIAAGVALRFLVEANPNFYLVLGGTLYSRGVPPLDYRILFTLGEVNVIIAAFNLIPIPPLDGSAIVERILPVQWIPAYYQVRMSFMVIVLAVVFLFRGVLDSFFNWVVTLWFSHIVI